MVFNQAILYRMIKDLTKTDAKNAGINELTFYRLKDNPAYIYQTKSSTLIKILKLHSDLLSHVIIGIDVNKQDLFAAATADFEFTFSSGINVSPIYNNCSKDNKHQFRSQCGRAIKDLIEQVRQFDTPITFVIGHHKRNLQTAWSIHNATIVDFLKKNMYPDDQLYMIDESGTSITCPQCDHSSKLNRTEDNTFHCQNCDFDYYNDDIVAAANIAERFASGYDATKI